MNNNEANGQTRKEIAKCQYNQINKESINNTLSTPYYGTPFPDILSLWTVIILNDTFMTRVRLKNLF